MHRNFMGYTTQPSKLMIGLGVSAIGDSWTGFAQNIKVVERYMELVLSGEFPIFRGHILSEEDLMIRKLILDIMCHFKADLNEVKSSAVTNSLLLLKELESDNLLTVNEDEIRVTNSGRPYVRNICMAFDQRLMIKAPTTQIFSMTV